MNTRFLVACAAIVAGLSFTTDARGQDHPVFDAKGFQQNRDYFSALPFEHVDLASGGLVLTFTDLALPGNGGRELRFQRTYNSKVGYWTFGLNGIVLRVGDTWPNLQAPEDLGPALHTVDGGVHRAASQVHSYPDNWVESRRIMMTDRFWKYYRSSRILWMPDGTVGQYDLQGRLVELTDTFGNRVTFGWETPAAPDLPRVRVTQELGNGQAREVVLTFPVSQFGIGWGMPAGVPVSMSVTGEERTWTYVGMPLTEIIPPVGPSWRHEYGNPAHSIAIVTPHGGRIEYQFETRQFPTGFPPPAPQLTFTEVLTERRVFDVPERGGLSSGTWDYDYVFPGPDLAAQTIITAPDDTVTTFHHSWVTGTTSNNGALGLYPARTYLVTKRTVEKDGISLEEEDRTYEWVRIGEDEYNALPELKTQTITRDGAQYTKTYTYATGSFGGFHVPIGIEETGTATRTTVREFAHSANAPYDLPYFVARPTLERVTVGDESLVTTWTYDMVTGFRTSETQYGITTTFQPDAYGNIATSRRRTARSRRSATTGGR